MVDAAEEQRGHCVDIDGDVIDALLNLFDLCGFFGGGGGGGSFDGDRHGGASSPRDLSRRRRKPPRRQAVVALLRRLALLVQDSRFGRQEESAAAAYTAVAAFLDDSEASFLLLVEDTLKELRETLRAYAGETLSRERLEVLSLRQTLERRARELIIAPPLLSDENDDDDEDGTTSGGIMNWILLGRSVSLSLQRQIHREERILRNFEEAFCDAIYSSNENAEGSSNGGGGSSSNQKQALLSFISTTIDAISRDMSLEVSHPHYREAAMALLQPEGNRGAEGDREQTTNFKSMPIIPDEMQSRCSTEASACVITRESTVHGAVRAFLATENDPEESSGEEMNSSSNNSSTSGAVTFLLVVGPEGSGKTHICDTAERSAREAGGVAVIRPRIPIDFLGSSVGETEDAIVSVFCAAYNNNSKHRRVLLLLDDVEHILAPSQPDLQPGSSVGDTQSGLASHFMKRCQATFLSMMDSGSESVNRRKKSVLVLCTCKSASGTLACRFDRIYNIDLPPAAEIRGMIVDTLDLGSALGDCETPGSSSERQKKVESLLDSVVESSVGKSFAEIAQYCREAVDVAYRNLKIAGAEGGLDEGLLKCLKSRLLSTTPASLRESILDDYVDMRVLNAVDLGLAPSSDDQAVNYEMPLQGNSAAKAWRALVSSIVIPLCRSRELMALLDGGDGVGSSNKRIVVGGVLICGPPASGKSAIAFECAKYAASLLPSLKVLDVSCTSLIHKEVGGSERAVHHLFDAARRAAPCIVMMDGIENIAAVRGNDATTEGTLDRVLSTLLVELDGIDTHKSSKDTGREGIAVIGITQDDLWVDPALKRPGRLEKVVWLAKDWA